MGWTKERQLKYPDGWKKTRIALVKSRIGKKHTKEWKEKASERMQGNTKGFQKGQISLWKGKHHTEASKQKMSEAKLKNPTKYWLGKKRDNPEYIEKIKNAHLGQKGSQKQKEIAMLNWLKEKNPRWSGGRCVSKRYVKTYDNEGKYKQEHRIIAERIIGRKLKRTETIHHIDENKINNNPDNLYYFQNDNLHKSFHGLKNKPILQSNLLDYKVTVN